MSRRIRAALSLCLAATSWVLLSAALLLPTLFGSGAMATLFAAGFIAGVQAGQSSFVQVAPSLLKYWVVVEAVLTVAGIASAALAGWTTSLAVVPIAATISGACLGIPLGASASRVLASRGGLAYQAFQVQRSVLICVAVALASLVFRDSSTAAFALAAASLGLGGAALTMMGRSQAQAVLSEQLEAPALVRPLAYVWVVFGLLASLYYRNDTTWLRASVAAEPEFEIWHISLIGYSALQGFIGFVVVQRLFARRAEVAVMLQEKAERYRLVVMLGWISISSVILATSVLLPIPFSVAMSALLSVVVGFASGLAHVARRNWAPYLGGILGTTALLLILRADFDPRLALAATNVVIGYVLLGALISVKEKR
ncbi:hypothetical protein E5344_02315 [Microbacterium laevaniformans]|uniref:Uncharacterized protein n=1 Tax=Microbacterium laevaniformans TaxID=36807 RepID=A0A4S2DC64_9MICO|nr:hypothetical protein [Microbacterium laevaniformans]TGY39457.1 hypothetical protein E5344_02315 [Microbacterium laevaniformans]